MGNKVVIFYNIFPNILDNSPRTLNELSMSIKKAGTNIRMQKVAECFTGHINDKTRVLDIGAGNGYISHYLQNKFGCKISCADIVNYLEYDLPFFEISDTKLSFEDNSFDVAIIIDTLHHMKAETQVAMLQEAVRVAKKVIIFETERTLLALLLDKIMSKVQSMSMLVPCTHKTRKGWGKLFFNLGIEFKEVQVKRDWLYPMEHLCFIINKPIKIRVFYAH